MKIVKKEPVSVVTLTVISATTNLSKLRQLVQ